MATERVYCTRHCVHFLLDAVITSLNSLTTPLYRLENEIPFSESVRVASFVGVGFDSKSRGVRKRATIQQDSIGLVCIYTGRMKLK